MIIHDVEQGSDEWFDIRLGIPTASEAQRILTPTGKLSAASDGFIDKLLAERARLDMDLAEFDGTDCMQRGSNIEEEARKFYKFMHNEKVVTVGFITNDDMSAGCSPDGLINSGGWEGKAPMAKTQFGYLRANTLPPKYVPQVHFSMAVTGLDKWVFQSYHPCMAPLIIHVERDNYTEKVAAALDEFVDRLENEAARFGLERKALEKAE